MALTHGEHSILLFSQECQPQALKILAKSASRALGVVISKSRAMGGFNYNVYTSLYNSTVKPILEYGSEIWGHKSYSCLNAVYHRACRAFLGVGRYTPNLGIEGDMGWEPPVVRQKANLIRLWCRFSKMDPAIKFCLLSF